MGRLLQCAVLLAASMAWAEETASVVGAVEEAPHHALWLRSAFSTTPSGSIAYEHWFSPQVSLTLALGGSVAQNGAQIGSLGGTINGNVYTASTEVELRWHWSSGVFVAEAIGLSWSRTAFPAAVSAGLGAFGFNSDTAFGFESVFVGWGHNFGALRFELLAGPQLSMGLAGPSAAQLGVKTIQLHPYAGLGLGYTF